MTTPTKTKADPGILFSQAFEAELAQYPEDANWYVSGRPTKANPHGEDAEWWRAEGPKMVQRWIDWRERTPWDIWIAPDGQPGIELEIRVDIGGQQVVMYLDNVFATAPDNQRPIVLDKKTGTRVPDNNLQLGLYKVGLETQYPGTVISGGCYWNGRTGEHSSVVGLPWATYKYYERLFADLAKARANDIYLPNVGPMCKSCSVGRFCAINNGEAAYADPDFTLMA